MANDIWVLGASGRIGGGFVFQQLAQPDAESVESAVQFFVRVLGADLPTRADTVTGS